MSASSVPNARGFAAQGGDQDEDSLSRIRLSAFAIS
jgi:hypothetical protein